MTLKLSFSRQHHLLSPVRAMPATGGFADKFNHLPFSSGAPCLILCREFCEHSTQLSLAASTTAVHRRRDEATDFETRQGILADERARAVANAFPCATVSPER